MIFGLGVPEILLICVVIALIFGPAVFTKTGKTLGKTLHAFRKEVDDNINETADEEATESNE